MGFCLLLIFALSTLCSGFRNYTSSMQLSVDGTTLFWTVRAGVLEVGLQAPSLGWVAVGFATTATLEYLPAFSSLFSVF